jgi:hypothetical protein
MERLNVSISIFKKHRLQKTPASKNTGLKNHLKILGTRASGALMLRKRFNTIT